LVPALSDNYHDLNGYLHEVEDAVDDKGRHVEQLQQDLESSADDKRGEIDELKQRMTTFENVTVDSIKDDIEGIKGNMSYLEEDIIKDVSSQTVDISQLQNDVIKLKNDVKKTST
jgi:polyhydroxyalkanoate synthesis regulator phasin